jgi:hypothetical protein
LCCGLVVVAGLGLGLALVLCMALYSILYTIPYTGYCLPIFNLCLVLPLGWAGGLLAAGFNLCHLPSAICNLQSSWPGLAAVAVTALLLAVVDSGPKFGVPTGPPAGQLCVSHLFLLAPRCAGSVAGKTSRRAKLSSWRRSQFLQRVRGEAGSTKLFLYQRDFPVPARCGATSREDAADRAVRQPDREKVRRRTPVLPFYGRARLGPLSSCGHNLVYAGSQSSPSSRSAAPLSRQATTSQPLSHASYLHMVRAWSRRTSP